MTTANSLFFTSLLLAASLSAQPCAPTPRGLSAHFSFDLPGIPAPLLAPGRVGKALHLNGSGQYLEVSTPHRGLEMGSEDFTIEGWVRTRDPRRARSIIDKRDTTPSGYLVFLHNGQLGFQLASGADRSDVAARTTPIHDGRWHHFAVVARRLPPQPALIFLDGQPRPVSGRNLTIESVDTPHTPLWFGRHHPNQIVNRDNLYFAGDIDEVAFYRRPLTPAEITTIFRAGSHGKCAPR